MYVFSAFFQYLLYQEIRKKFVELVCEVKEKGKVSFDYYSWKPCDIFHVLYTHHNKSNNILLPWKTTKSSCYTDIYMLVERPLFITPVILTGHVFTPTPRITNESKPKDCKKCKRVNKPNVLASICDRSKTDFDWAKTKLTGSFDMKHFVLIYVSHACTFLVNCHGKKRKWQANSGSRAGDFEVGLYVEQAD